MAVIIDGKRYTTFSGVNAKNGIAVDGTQIFDGDGNFANFGTATTGDVLAWNATAGKPEWKATGDIQ